MKTRNILCGITAGVLAVFAVASAIPAPRAEALGISVLAETQADATIDVSKTVQHPCNNADMVSLSGTVNVHSKTSVSNSGASVSLSADASSMIAQNMTSGMNYSVSSMSSGSVSLGPLPASGSITTSATLTGSNGEQLTAYFDFKVSAGTNGATTATLTNIRLACGS